MTKVYIVNQFQVSPVYVELTGNVTPIKPIQPVVIQFGSPQAIDEWEIPPAPLSIALDRETAIELAIALYQVTTQK